MSINELKSMSPRKLDEAYWKCGNVTQLAITYSCDRGATRRLLRQKKTGPYHMDVIAMGGILQGKIAPILTGCLRLKGNWIVTADWHIPTHSMEWIGRLLNTAKCMLIKRLIIGGDFIDFAALSYYYLKENGDQRAPKVDMDYECTEGVLDVLETWFDEIIWILGNHEWRFMRMHRWGAKPTKLLSILNRLCDQRYRISGLSYCYVDDIRVTHPKSFRNNKLSMANSLAAKYRCPVIQAHGHFLSLGFSTGGYRIADSGCLCDPDRTQYIAQADTSHNRWNNGFVIYKDGELAIIGDGVGLIR